MAHTHNADIDLDMTREPAPPSEAKENRRLAVTGLAIVLALLVAILGTTFLALSHKGHIPQLTPGQPQTPAAVALLNGASFR